MRDQLLPSGEAYIRFDGFKDPVIKEFQTALEKYHDAPGVIIDLRHNGGGKFSVLSAVAGYFLNSKTTIAGYLGRQEIDSAEKSGENNEPQNRCPPENPADKFTPAHGDSYDRSQR